MRHFPLKLNVGVFLNEINGLTQLVNFTYLSRWHHIPQPALLRVSIYLNQNQALNTDVFPNEINGLDLSHLF
jgi:hypothetical protein